MIWNRKNSFRAIKVRKCHVLGIYISLILGIYISYVSSSFYELLLFFEIATLKMVREINAGKKNCCDKVLHKLEGK